MKQEESRKLMEDIIDELIKSRRKERKMIIHTEREGAINFETEWRCQIYQATKKPYNRAEVRKQVEKMDWPTGPYEITEFGVKFIG